jgi:high-affinity nickel-transport protein
LTTTVIRTTTSTDDHRTTGVTTTVTPVTPGDRKIPMPRGAATRSPAQLAQGGTSTKQLIFMAATIVLLTGLGWSVMAWSVRPDQVALNTEQTFGWGVGLTAYLLGIRHAFDADHIAAIDNTTRKLVQEDKHAGSVGFWFSLGHSTVVFLLALLVAIGARTIVGSLDDDDSTLKQSLGLIGTLVGGGFLVLLGLLNLQALIGIARVFWKMRTERLDEEALEKHLNSRGFFARILRRALSAVRKPWHMYGVGFAFGIGFDTATEVTLLVIAGGVAAESMPWYTVLVIPVLFAAGMCLFDTADGVLMSAAYRWAFITPVRKVFYNLAITALSVVVAVGIGGIELLQLLGEELGITGSIFAFLSRMDLEQMGYMIVGLFAATWILAISIWRFGRIEERWSI